MTYRCPYPDRYHQLSSTRKGWALVLDWQCPMLPLEALEHRRDDMAARLSSLASRGAVEATTWWTRGDLLAATFTDRDDALSFALHFAPELRGVWPAGG